MMYTFSEHHLCRVRLRRTHTLETLFFSLIDYNDTIY